MNRKWLLVARPEGLPKASDFLWVEEPLQPLEQGQVRVRIIYLSIDPASRIWMSHDSYVPAVPLGDTMRGGAIGVVEESSADGFQPGDKVQGVLGWQTHWTGEAALIRPLPKVDIPLGAHFGLLSHIGLTAYFGLLDIGAPKEGETLVVSAAAGAVGSLVGQIGKIKGCRVVGIAGSSEKCAWLTSELGFDAAINYKTEKVSAALKEHCPNGADIYFENTGGKILEAVLNRMNNFGRIPACGMIAGYNGLGAEPGPSNLFHIVSKRLKMQGFIVTDYLPRAKEAVADLVSWYKSGRIQYRLDVSEGLENAPSAVVRMLQGGNTGKAVVQVAPEP
ncbi:MAG: NADP-dependent oxidoreductase [Acidobacteria bacterium]|nr:NADP-dependent oxidoreductase [Acidobacteriota bacterium]